MRKDLFGRPTQTRQKTRLGQKFLWPPFSVFNAREGDWQDRKREWIALGIRSELGRGEGLLLNGEVGTDIDTYRHKEGTKKLGVTFGTNGGERDRFEGLEAQAQRERLMAESNGKKYHAQPGGGPSKKSVWLGANNKPVGGEDAINASKQTASLKGGLTFGTTINPYGGSEGGEASQTGTSIFDPVLCELFYKWFTPARGLILDPFAGGSVRGVVASKLGRDYVGVDLRPEQITANEQQALDICDPDTEPMWLQGDSRNITEIVSDIGVKRVDAVFSCPPYFDLEVYSADPRDISNTGWDGFCEAYRSIIKQCVMMLKPNRFACFVVGDIRDKEGFYRSLPAVTVDYFEEAGCRLYNEALLVTAVGSLPLRIGRQFTASRKLGRSHQSVLVFVKGDPKIAAAACEPFELLDVSKLNKIKSSEIVVTK